MAKASPNGRRGKQNVPRLVFTHFGTVQHLTELLSLLVVDRRRTPQDELSAVKPVVDNVCHLKTVDWPIGLLFVVRHEDRASVYLERVGLWHEVHRLDWHHRRNVFERNPEDVGSDRLFSSVGSCGVQNRCVVAARC